MSKKTKKVLKAETFKVKPVETPKEEPKEPIVAEVVTPETKVATFEPGEKGYKRPSITDMVRVHTKKGYKKLMEAYRKQNPRKYKQKKSALEAKMRRLK